MAGKIPGLGGVSILAAGFMLLKSEADMQARIKACEKHPRQRLIESIVCDHNSHIDMIHYAQEIHCLENDAYKATVRQYCNEFNVPFNGTICSGIGMLNNMDKTTSRDPDVIRAEIKAAFDAEDEKNRKAQEAYDALPWYERANWGMIVVVGIAVFGFIMWGLGLT